VLASFTLHVIEHGWQFHCRIEVNLTESPHVALSTGKLIPTQFSLPRPSMRCSIRR